MHLKNGGGLNFGALAYFFFSDLRYCTFLFPFPPLAVFPFLAESAAPVELTLAEGTVAISTSSAKDGREWTIRRRMWREARR